MKTTIKLLIVSSIATLLAACATHAPILPAPYGSAQVAHADWGSMRKLDVTAQDFNNTEGNAIAQASVTNKTQIHYAVAYRWQWFTQNGRLIETPASTWIAIDLLPGETRELQSAAPSPEATRVRITFSER